MNRIPRTILLASTVAYVAGCASSSTSSPDMAQLRNMYAYRGPVQMRQHYLGSSPPPPMVFIPPPLTPQTPGEKPVPIQRPLPPPQPTNPEPTPVDPATTIEAARDKATQHPTPEGFINAVQVYHFEPGAVYEVLTVPGFVTVLHLRPGEELRNLAAGDTSRWHIDSITSGNVDAQGSLGSSPLINQKQAEHDRVCVLVKPRKPFLFNNLVIATNERTYLIDLKSVEESAYHSVVEWTYPQPAFRHSKSINNPVPPVTLTEEGPRNYIYSLKGPAGALPSWAPEAVYDDGHRVHVLFPKSINDLRRPPLFGLDADGTVRMVNYRSEPDRYVVDELFEQAALRIGNERVIIERTLPRPNQANDSGN